MGERNAKWEIGEEREWQKEGVRERERNRQTGAETETEGVRSERGEDRAGLKKR